MTASPAIPDDGRPANPGGGVGSPRPLHPAGRALRQVAVIGDGTGHGPPAQPGRPLATILAGDAATLQRLARIPAVTRPASQWDATDTVAEQIRQFPPEITAVLLTRTSPTRARSVQRLVEQAGGRPVLTDEDATAIALTAAALVYLRGLGRDQYRARILIADATRMPILSALLLATGFPDITLWNTPDAAWFPLHRAARDADVVIDLQHAPDSNPTGSNPMGAPALGEQGELSAVGFELDRPEGSVITPRALDDGRMLIAPGLLRALAEYPATAPPLGLGIYEAVARAVAHATPARRRLHGVPDRDPATGTPDVADAIAGAVTLHLALTRP
ncbi:MAG: hypothetical protein J0I49_25070 [Pseudonocardia sp.]|uniref:hypothetical protein n=1 Tax=Pseudonocardia sp. TaxID=60912 RepID=UPI001AC6A515|nr:hypothetical protein [Pseudonocardia sp.]MBN9101355.1 hypothetical protein [Pseudonocardia sp.]